MLGLTLNAFSNTSRTAAQLPPIYLLKISEPLTLKYFILNQPYKAAPIALFPFPVAPYSNIPLGSLIGADLNRNEYFIGFQIMAFIVCFAQESPASFEKSVTATLLEDDCDSSIAHLLKAANVSDSVLSEIV